MRMKTTLFALVILLTLSTQPFAGGLEKELAARWLGAWVVTTTEAYSDCASYFTNNRVNGQLVNSKGAYRFRTGELARVRKVNLGRSRLDVHLTFAEPLLIAYQDGPFTLYREAHCRVEFEVMVPRSAVKQKDAGMIDAIIAEVVERFPTEAEAQQAHAWNHRQLEPFPENYGETLYEHAVWKVDTHNVLVESRIDNAVRQTSRTVDRVASDTDYLHGFAEGIETARELSWPDSCRRLLAMKLSPEKKTARASHAAVKMETGYTRGLNDGKTLVMALELMRRLPGCFLPEPDRSEFVGHVE